MFQAGLYPVSANVPLGAQTGATPDGRLAYTPVADGVSPSAGKDTHGPTSSANSVSKLSGLFKTAALTVLGLLSTVFLGVSFAGTPIYEGET